MEINTQSAPIPSFGRRRGRRLRASRERLFETLLPQLLISNTENIRLENLFEYAERSLWFEIGFGGGEHLAQQALQNTQVNFIGCEPYINGMSSLLVAVDKQAIRNVRLYDGDARILLNNLPDHSIERMFVLFPDPWPKNRHHKKRIISQQTLKLFYQKIKPGGLLRIATDHADYAAWILENLLLFKKFEWQAKTCGDWKDAPSDWVVTRYQEKAKAEGRGAIFLDWVAKE